MRKSKYVVIPPAEPDRTDRDAGKCYLITEMDSVSAEKWAMRALLAIAASGVDIDPEMIRHGSAALLAAGFRSLMHMAFADAEPLLDEMMACVSFVPDRAVQSVTRPLIPDDIEEVSTRLRLRSEVIELHLGFSIAAFLSKLGQAAKTTASNTSNIPTSPV